MKFVETCGRLLNIDDITEISYLDMPCNAEIIIEKKNGKEIRFPVSNREDYEARVYELIGNYQPDVVEYARYIKEYCHKRAFGKCKSCALYNNGCFVGHAHKDELTDSYDVDYPLDWDLD